MEILPGIPLAHMFFKMVLTYRSQGSFRGRDKTGEVKQESEGDNLKQNTTLFHLPFTPLSYKSF